MGFAGSGKMLKVQGHGRYYLKREEKDSGNLRHSDHTSGCGVHCAFFLNGAKPDDESGPFALKFYPDKRMRDVCYDRQTLAHAYGLGPPVGDCVTLTEITPNYTIIWYGYETRVAVMRGMPGFPWSF